jgi:hypothetical protein
MVPLNSFGSIQRGRRVDRDLGRKRDWSALSPVVYTRASVQLAGTLLSSCLLLSRFERMFYPPRMQVEYRIEPCKSALTQVRGMPFKWSLNPYMGCVHRCTFCYVRHFEQRADRPSDDRYGRSIRVKTNVAEVLRRELARASWQREEVAVGTATDPYQPAERKFRLTRACNLRRGTGPAPSIRRMVGVTNSWNMLMHETGLPGSPNTGLLLHTASIVGFPGRTATPWTSTPGRPSLLIVLAVKSL